MNNENIITRAEWIVLHPSTKSTVPIPESILRDDEIRAAMERALKKSEEEVTEISKLLLEDEAEPLLIVTVELPFQLPSATDNGTNNEALKVFAYDAYDTLDHFFEKSAWGDWFIAPYFNQSDDRRDSMCLGLFIDENFSKTVVE